MNTQENDRGLSGKQLLLVRKVHEARDLGELPAASLEIVLRRGGTRFAALDERQIARIRELAEEAGVQLPC